MKTEEISCSPYCSRKRRFLYFACCECLNQFLDSHPECLVISWQAIPKWGIIVDLDIPEGIKEPTGAESIDSKLADIFDKAIERYENMTDEQKNNYIARAENALLKSKFEGYCF